MIAQPPQQLFVPANGMRQNQSPANTHLETPFEEETTAIIFWYQIAPTGVDDVIAGADLGDVADARTNLDVIKELPGGRGDQRVASISVVRHIAHSSSQASKFLLKRRPLVRVEKH
jgi:hypothetical protein